MRSRAICDDDHSARPVFSMGFRDEAPAPKAFVVRVGRDNNQAATTQRLGQRGKWKGMRRSQKFAGGHANPTDSRRQPAAEGPTQRRW